MPPAATLPIAAGQAADRLQSLWILGTLKTQLTAFWQATINTFPEQISNSHPVSNWLTIIATIADQMSSSPGLVLYQDLQAAVQAVYRLCWMTNYLQSIGLITAAQGSTGPNSILVQYNANF